MAAVKSKMRYLLSNLTVVVFSLYLCLNAAGSSEPGYGKDLSLATDEALREAICQTKDSSVLDSWTGDCLSELFDKYGSRGKITFDGFRRLLVNMGLGAAHATSSNTQEYKPPGVVKDVFPLTTESINMKDNASPVTDPKSRYERATGSLGKNLTGEGAVNGTSHDILHPDHHYNKHHIDNCLSPDEILDTFSMISSDGLTHLQFLQLCPLLIQQLDNHVCVVYDVHRSGDGHNHTQAAPTEDVSPELESSSFHQGQVWGYSFGAVTLISVASVTCIMMVPCIQRFPVAYGRLLSFLVAMAVGTLSGDSILHLLPHAYGIHGHREEATNATAASDPTAAALSEENKNLVVWRGCVMLLGIFSFFIFEQVMRMCQKRPKKRLESKQSFSSESDKDDLGSQEIGERLCNHHEMAHELVPMIHQSIDETKGGTDKLSSTLQYKDRISSSSLPHLNNVKEEEKTVTSNSYRDLSYVGMSSSICKDPLDFTESTPNNGRESSRSSLEDGESKERRKHKRNHHQQREHHHHHHGHGHSHSHSHAAKGTISAIAWMVVMGDGIHNFTDGLVVGAAFADGLAGGLSTAIAVMCHEIPHELGDFAVMLQGGMSIKQALVFQAVSSVLAYIGMAIGICIGTLSSVSLWIFALAGGMFLYIALTDLFPEMVESMNHTTDNKACHLLLQVLGASFGVGAMLVIALYEELLIAALSQ